MTLPPLSFLDKAIFFAVLGITFASVLWGYSRRSKGNDQESFLDLLLMGRKLTLPMFVATLVATWYGGIFGVTQIAFERGIFNFITQGVFWYVTYLIFAFFLVDRIRKTQAVTLPDLVSQMYGPVSGRVSAVFNFFNVVPIAYAIGMGLFLQAFWGGNLEFWIAVGTGCVVLYSMFGGFRAVVFSDLVQFFVMCLGVFLVFVFAYLNFGGLDFLRSHLPETHFTISGGESWGTVLVWGFLALATLVDPNFYHRCFAADSSRTAKRGILLSTLIWFCFDICTTAGGMYARAVFPEAESGQAYLFFAMKILPDGLRGLVLAGIFATILSTVDSYVFLAGTTLTHDLLPHAWRGKKWLHHMGIAFVGALAVILAGQFDGDIREVWKTLGSYSAACLLLPVLFGYFFPKRLRDRQFVLACFVGVVVTTFWRLFPRAGFWSNVDELYVGMLATGATLLIFLKGKTSAH